MKVPHTREEMERADYLLSDVSKVFPDVKPNTLQVWIKRGVIKPAVPSQGQGFSTRFNYLNLIEIGLVSILVSRGINKHEYLTDLLNSGIHEFGTSLVEKMRAFKFARYLLLPGGMRVVIPEGEEIKKDDLHPLYFLRAPEELHKLSEAFGIPDWFVVNVSLLKAYVDGKIGDL